MEATINPEVQEKRYFECDRLGGRFSVDQCRTNRKRPGDSISVRIHCRDCDLARALDAGDVPTFTLAEMFGDHQPAPPPEPVARKKAPPKKTPNPKRAKPPPVKVALPPTVEETKSAPSPPPEKPPPDADYANYAFSEAPPEAPALADFERGTRFLTRPRRWTGDELELLLQEYPAGDLDDLAEKLGRKRSTLNCKASELKIRRTVYIRKKRRKHEMTPEIEAELRSVYARGRRYSGEINALARRFKRPRWWVSQQAIYLALVPKRTKEPNWCDRELKILEVNAHRSPEHIRSKLKKEGFQRTLTGIVLKRKRLKLTAPNLNGYSANRLAGALGVDPQAVTGWIKKGWLKSEGRGLHYTEAQNGSEGYWIRPLWVKRFIVEHAEMLDLGKVDRSWFVEILAGTK